MKVPNSTKVSHLNAGLKNSDAYRNGWDAVFGKKEECDVCGKPIRLTSCDGCAMDDGECPALCHCKETK